MEHLFTVKLTVPKFNVPDGKRTLVVVNAQEKTIRKPVPLQQEFARIDLYAGTYSTFMEDTDSNGNMSKSKPFEFSVTPGIEQFPTMAAIILERKPVGPDPFDSEVVVEPEKAEKSEPEPETEKQQKQQLKKQEQKEKQ